MSIYNYVCTLLRSRSCLSKPALILLAFVLACSPYIACAQAKSQCVKALAYIMGSGAGYGTRQIAAQIADKTIKPSPVILLKPEKAYTPKIVERGVETFSQLALESFLFNFFENKQLPAGISLNDLHKYFILGMRLPRYVELSQAAYELLKDMSHLVAELAQDIVSYTSIHCYSYSLDYPLASQGHSTALNCGPNDPYCLKQGGPSCAGLPLEEYIRKHSITLTSTLGHLSVELFAFAVGMLFAGLSYWISVYMARLLYTDPSAQGDSRPLLLQQGLAFIQKTINNVIDVVVIDPVRDEFLKLIEKTDILEDSGTSTALINIGDVRDTLLAGEKSTKMVKIGTVLKKFRNPFSKFISNVMYGKGGK